MIDNTKLNEILANIKISESDSAFVGAMPTGDATLVSVATEPRVLNSNNWYPVTFKASDGQEYELSLKGLLQAEGLKYNSRNLKERVKAWYTLAETGKTAAGRKFNYQGKKGKEVTYKKDWTDFNNVTHHAGEKGTIEGHTFSNKVVG